MESTMINIKLEINPESPQITQEFTITYDDFDDICRTCLSQNQILRPIADLIKNNDHMYTILENYGLININDAYLPRNICEECLKSIEAFRRFVNRSKDAQIYLSNVAADKEKAKNEVFFVESKGDVLKRNENSKYACHLCNKTLANAYNLKIHYLMHDDLKPLKCEICQMEFRARTTLNKHKLIHTDKKPFECDICKKTFRKKFNLNAHKNIHDGNKAFVCTFCSKSFIRKESLVMHQNTHLEKKPFACLLCEQTFAWKAGLNKHVVKCHDGENLHECDVCHKLCRDLTDLRRHKQVHQNSKPFKCDFCDKSFGLLKYLKAHLRLHVKEEPLKYLL